ncbi:MAG: hypothetical protein N2316_03835 [Spirochaetes bacterium]|nr:hypothetical protein [Spirochaetota bacterium]
MWKRTLLVMVVLVFAFPEVLLFAQEFIGIGLHGGLQNDTGNLSNQYRTIEYEPQNSALVGFSFKINMHFIFVRTGCDVAFVLNKSQIEDSTSQIESYSLRYVDVPGFVGFRFPLREVGEFYMGTGVVYYIGDVKYKLITSESSSETLAFARGWSFVTGIEFRIIPFARLYMEWQYHDSRSEAVINTEGNTYNDHHIDFSGHRIFLGAMYYII